MYGGFFTGLYDGSNFFSLQPSRVGYFKLPTIMGMNPPGVTGIFIAGC